MMTTAQQGQTKYSPTLRGLRKGSSDRQTWDALCRTERVTHLLAAGVATATRRSIFWLVTSEQLVYSDTSFDGVKP